jgi:hypothetical protein
MSTREHCVVTDRRCPRGVAASWRCPIHTPSSQSSSGIGVPGRRIRCHWAYRALPRSGPFFRPAPVRPAIPQPSLFSAGTGSLTNPKPTGNAAPFPSASPTPKPSYAASRSYRSKATKIRGRVFIYARLGRYGDEAEREMMIQYGIGYVTSDDLPRGTACRHSRLT